MIETAPGRTRSVSAEPLTVILADDHAFILDGMSDMMRTRHGLRVVATCDNGVKAISLVKKLKPALAVLDDQMPDATGLEAFVESRRWSPETRFAIVTGNGHPARLSEMVEAGVHGVFLKTGDPADICDGIMRVGAGERVLGAGVEARLSQASTPRELTARERQVLEGIARGQSNARIAEAIGVSPKTVDKHRTSLMAKMEVHSIAALLLRAVRDGMINVD